MARFGTTFQPVEITFLGGLGEVGRNCTAIERAGKILVVDCGVMFPPRDSPVSDTGEQDFVLPDLAWLAERSDAVEAVVLTHGHLDHIGALPKLVEALGVTSGKPLSLYGTPFTLALAAKRLEEFHCARRVSFNRIADGSVTSMGSFRVEAISAAHSIPQAISLGIRTEQGLILHSGDFKLDPDPIDGRKTDVERLRSLRGNVTLALVDSTNAMDPGVSGSESEVVTALDDIFAFRKGKRVFVSCFASNVHRLQSIVDTSRRYGRKVCLVGSSLRSNSEIAEMLNIFHLPHRERLSPWQLDGERPGEVTVICTGAQGEERSALYRIGHGTGNVPTVRSGDTVVFSSSVIPGNEESVTTLMALLRARGAEVLGPEEAHAHVSGHACADELKTWQEIVSPANFTPVHGTEEMLLAHGALATEAGLSSHQLAICALGETLRVSDRGVAVTSRDQMVSV
jgi:ribonuclease J